MTMKDIQPELTKTALTVLEKRYFIKDENGKPIENASQMFRRVADYVASAEEKYGKTKEEIRKIADEFYGVMARLEALPNSPCLMSAGVKGRKKMLSACFVIPVTDSLDEIFDAIKNVAMIHKSGGGTGLDFSRLRGKNSRVGSTKGVSSGAISFMEVFDSATNVIKQGGLRKGANMGVLRIDHPDIEEFITCKTDLKKLNNFNISVALTDKFIECVKKDKDFDLICPATKKVIKTVKAKYLWDKIVDCAWNSAEPGILFLDTINRYNPLPEVDEIRASNPCFSGDTIIAVADGRNGVSIKELSDKVVEFDIYSARNRKTNAPHIANHKVEIKRAKAFKTGTRELIRVTLSDGSSFKCTPEHPLALADGGKDIQYVRADNSLGLILSKFFTFTNLGYGHKYRHINSFTANRQYKIISEFNDLFGKIHHIDGDSLNDNISNLVIADENHLSIHFTQDNPLYKQEYNFRCYVNSKRNVLANYTHHKKTESWLNEQLASVEKRFTDTISNHKKIQSTAMTSNGLAGNVFVCNIETVGIEEVYDISVQDNHNFYIITKTLDNRYLNCSGMLVHNCGEVPMSDWNSCNLLSINLAKFVSNNQVDYKKLEEVVKTTTRFLDNVIDVNEYPLQKITDMSLNSRSIGLGIMGLADMLAMMMISYASEQGRQKASEVFKFIHETSINTSKELAKEKGNFPFISKSIFKNEKYMRNSTHTVVAPTGSISLFVDASSGCEPYFALAFNKNVMDGESFAFINPYLEKMLNETGLMDEQTKKDIAKTGSVQHINKIPKDIKEVFKVSNEIDVKDHIAMQAELQKHCSLAISKTINLNKDATKEEVSEAYMYAHKMGCKGVTVYRDGCRQNQVLTVGIDNKEDKKEKNIDLINRGAVPERPECVDCEIHNITVKGTPYVVLAGIKNGQLYEVFVDYALKSDGELRIPKHIKKGIICKVKRGRFDLQVKHEDGLQTTLIENIAGAFDSTAGTLTRMVSLSLQSGATLERIVEQLGKSKDMVNFSKALMRVIKQFIKDGETVTVGDTKCPECGSKLHYESGCVSCSNHECGWSKCS